MKPEEMRADTKIFIHGNRQYSNHGWNNVIDWFGELCIADTNGNVIPLSSLAIDKQGDLIDVMSDHGFGDTMLTTSNEAQKDTYTPERVKLKDLMPGDRVRLLDDVAYVKKGIYCISKDADGELFLGTEEQPLLIMSEFIPYLNIISKDQGKDAHSMDNRKPTNPKEAFGVEKVSMSVVPVTVLAEIALALQEGALKYGAHNYLAMGARASVYYDAAQRHLMDWQAGEDEDSKSLCGISHVTKAISSLVVLRASMIQENWVDDRPIKSPKGWLDAINEKVKKLLASTKMRTPPFTEKDRNGISRDYQS